MVAGIYNLDLAWYIIWNSKDKYSLGIYLQPWRWRISLKDLATVGCQNWYTELSHHEGTPSTPMPGDPATVQNILETLA